MACGCSLTKPPPIPPNLVKPKLSAFSRETPNLTNIRRNLLTMLLLGHLLLLCILPLPLLNLQLHPNYSKRQLPTSTWSAYPGTLHRLAVTTKTKHACAFSSHTKHLLALYKSKPCLFHLITFICTT